MSGSSVKVVSFDLVLLSLGSETQHLEQMVPVNMHFKGSDWYIDCGDKEGTVHGGVTEPRGSQPSESSPAVSFVTSPWTLHQGWMIFFGKAG